MKSVIAFTLAMSVIVGYSAVDSFTLAAERVAAKMKHY